MSANTGGPAFPLAAGTGDPRDGVYCQNGMTLLDWFAGQALEGMAASSYWAENVQVGRRDYLDPMAQSAYAMAEAMLAEKLRRESEASPQWTGEAVDTKAQLHRVHNQEVAK